MNPAPCVPLDWQTSGLVVRSALGSGVLARRRFGVNLASWWVYVEGSRRWRLCEPTGLLTRHAGDQP